MNTTSEETREDGKQRRKSIGTPGSGGGQTGGLTVSGGKTKRHSMVINRKSIGEEGNTVPNYLRASTGSCHDFCKYGKKHEHSNSSIPVKFKRSTLVNKEKVKKSAIKPFPDPKIELPLKKPQILKRVLSKPKENEVKVGQRSTSLVKPSSGSNGSNSEVVKKKDIKTVKKTGTTPGDVKKVVVKGTKGESESPKASSLKTIKYKNVKKVSPLKDQNRMQKTVCKEESEDKNESIEFDYIQEMVGISDSLLFSSQELINDPVLTNGFEKESTIMHSVNESSNLFQEQELLEDSSVAGVLKKSQSFSEVLEEDSLIAPPVSESSQSFYDDEEFTEEEEEYESSDNEKDEKVEKIPRKGRMVISNEKDEEGVKLRFRRGKILDIESVNNGPRRLKFRKGKVMEGNEGVTQDVSRRSYEKKYEKEINNNNNNNNNGGHESVVLKHQGEKEKKDAQGLFNNVIEETASKLVESRKSKVKALVGAFETVISLQDGKP